MNHANRLTRKKKGKHQSSGAGPYTSQSTVTEIIQRLAAYENAEESGRLVELPCRVGDTVYEVSGTEIYDMTVTKFEVGKSGTTVYLSDGYYDDYEGDESYIDCFGKTVFLTREEAETALKGAKE